MVQSEGGGEARRARRWRSVAENRRIAELTLELGASVALVARAHGVNANQVFKWRCELKRTNWSSPLLHRRRFFLFRHLFRVRRPT